MIELYELFDGFFEVCEVIGRHEMEQVSLLKRSKPEEGIRISYGGGSLCYSEEIAFQPVPRRTSFELVCASKQEENFKLVEMISPEYSICNTILRIKTPAGCPTAYQSGISLFWGVILLTLVLVLGYFALGCLYNRKNGSEGIDAIPHSEFWLELKEKVSSRFRRSGEASKQGSSSNHSYDTI